MTKQDKSIKLALRVVLDNLDNLTVEQFNQLSQAISNTIQEFAKQQEEAYIAHKRSQRYVTKNAQERNQE